MRHISCRGKQSSKWIRVWAAYILSIALYFGFQNLEDLEDQKIPFYAGPSNSEHYHFRLIYCILSNSLSAIFMFLFIILWETMIDRMSRQRETVKVLSNLIIRNTDSEYIEFDYIDNVLSWLALENFVKRKGMLLFSSMETPLLSLFALALVSWASTIGCIFKGSGLSLFTSDSLISNSALATWFYLALLSVFQVSRMLWQGHQFHRESKKQDKGMCIHIVFF